MKQEFVCVKNSKHRFQDITVYYCPICGGLLKEEDVADPIPVVATEKVEINRPVTPGDEPFSPTDIEPEIGLSVIMMDASSSMTDRAFDRIPLTRLSLVAHNAAQGIFDLERMQNNPNAYVALFKFDHRVEQMFVDSIANVIRKYKDVATFEAYIYKELFKMLEGTDINKALREAHSFVNRFMRKELTELPTQHYTPMVQRILRHNSADSVSIPNIRVLMYTDGKQYVENGSKVLEPNPFKTDPITDVNHDILIGAFFGAANAEGSRDLQQFVSNCPIHEIPQFFLFDDPAKIDDLKYLFRMASGASGFCPRCLERQLRR